MNKLQGTLNRQIGLCGEDVIKKCIELEGKTVKKPPPNTPAYDLILPNEKILIQVKTDANNDENWHLPLPEQHENLKNIASYYNYKYTYIYCNLHRQYLYLGDEKGKNLHGTTTYPIPDEAMKNIPNV